ncbi:DNA-processing protein DprA [Mesoplasma seiffertii]|uniref:DNA-processing protein DprA n=1 Tax=Mesoplasma seiffertii TaxID=28224 RepID=UPI000479D9CE|nr:DNA-processing protein DprA [Mesoplasma seiffertii]
MDNVLLYFSLKYNGDWNQIYDALERKEKIDSDVLLELTSSFKTPFITILSPLYPSHLKQSHKPPFVLFFKGSISLINNYHQILGCPDSQAQNEYGKQTTEHIVSKLIAEQRIILTESSKQASNFILNLGIKNKGRLIIVTKENLSTFVESNLELIAQLNNLDYLILSEYESSEIEQYVTDSKEDYLYRLLIGVSKAIVIFQSNENVKVNKIVNLGLADGKDIFVVPEPIFSKYKINNSLIKQGAKLIESGSDILNDL